MVGRGRGRGKGRGRKRRRECEYGEAAGGKLQKYHHQSHKTIHHQASQDYPFSPPFSCRGVVLTSPHYSNKPFGSRTIKTPNSSSTLTPTLIITLDEDDVKPEMHHHTPQPTYDNEREMDEPGVELISGIYMQPLLVYRSGGGKVVDYGRTEAAMPLIEDVEDEQSDGTSGDHVHGHRVKTEFVPMLRAIFDKYGNITSGTDVKSPDFLSTLLERICHIYQRLEHARFDDLTLAELQGMISELRLLERRKLSVGWILERVEYLAHTKNSFEDFQRDKDHEARFDALTGRIEKDLEAYEREVCMLQQKISSTKAELLMHKAKNNQMKESGGDIEARVIALQKQSLVHGFL